MTYATSDDDPDAKGVSPGGHSDERGIQVEPSLPGRRAGTFPLADEPGGAGGRCTAKAKGGGAEATAGAAGQRLGARNGRRRFRRRPMRRTVYDRCCVMRSCEGYERIREGV